MTEHPAGRPPSYRPEYAEMILEHFDVEPFRIAYEETRYERADGSVGPMKKKTPKIVANALPTVSWFAWEIGAHPATVARWARAKSPDWNPKYPEFSHAYARAREKQKSIIIINGGNGWYNAGFAMMLLKGLHMKNGEWDTGGLESEEGGGEKSGHPPDGRTRRE